MIPNGIKQIWLYPAVVDFRKQLNGLIVLIVDALDKDPASGELFLFRNRAGNKLKMVYFDGSCFWAKRKMKKHCFFPMSALPRMARQEVVRMSFLRQGRLS